MGERSRRGFLIRVLRRGLMFTYGLSADGETMRGSCDSGSGNSQASADGVGIFIIGTGTVCSTGGAPGDITWSPT